MKKTKSVKILALMVACTMTMAGCGGKNDKSETTGVKTEFTICDKPEELTVFCVRSDNKFIEETEVFKEIAKLTNVSLKTVNSRNVSDAFQAFSTLMASGNLPDMVCHQKGKEEFDKYGKEGAFEPLNELIDKYAPNVKKYCENPEVLSYITATDGKIYSFATIGEATVSAGWFIRQDWLDKLGLKTPENVEEYYQTLKAFRERDPNGNGLQDEVPYFSRFSVVTDLLSLWDTSDSWNQKNDKVYFAPTTPEFKEAYKNIAKWYAENLIDKEIFTRGWKGRDQLLADNVGGSTHDWFGSTAQFNDLLKDSVPGINLQAIAPPNGKEYYSRDIIGDGRMAISASSDKKEIAVKFVNFLYSKTGVRFYNFGIEGKHYDLKDDKEIFKDWVLHGDKTTINILEDAGSLSLMPSLNDFWYEEQWLNDSARAGARMYLDNNYLVPKFPKLSYTDEEDKKLMGIMASITTLVQETTQKWVFGSEDVDTGFDKFVKQMYDMGLGEAEKIQQKAYNRYKEKLK